MTELWFPLGQRFCAKFLREGQDTLKPSQLAATCLLSR